MINIRVTQESRQEPISAEGEKDRKRGREGERERAGRSGAGMAPYSRTSQLSLCQLCKPFSKSAQPLLMNSTFQTNKAWHSLLLLQQGSRQQHIVNNLITFSLLAFFFFSAQLANTRPLRSHDAASLTRCLCVWHFFKSVGDKCIY